MPSPPALDCCSCWHCLGCARCMLCIHCLVSCVCQPSVDPPSCHACTPRRLWIKYKFTNKRLVVTTNSPLLKREVQARVAGADAAGHAACCTCRGMPAGGHCCCAHQPLVGHAVYLQVSYDQIKEIRSAPRAFGLWGGECSCAA